MEKVREVDWEVSCIRESTGRPRVYIGEDSGVRWLWVMPSSRVWVVEEN